MPFPPLPARFDFNRSVDPTVAYDLNWLLSAGGGPTGAQGAQGATGTQGAAGTSGAQGAQGAAGSAGAQGAQGAAGSAGAQGAQGSSGAVGAQGAAGAQGATGSQGATGAQGTAGTNGAQGAQGAAGASGTGDVIQAAQVICASSQSTIHFATISGSYTNLEVWISGRDTQAGSETAAHLKINSDATAANYTTATYLQGTGGAPVSGTSVSTTAGGAVIQMVGSSGNADAVFEARIRIPNYSGSTFRKMVTGDSTAQGSGNLDKVSYSFTWLSNSAITDLVLTAGGTAFVDGTTATLYLYR